MDDAGLALVASLRGPELPVDDPRHDGPLVSIVVVTRDGLDHLRRLFAGLADTTRYRNVEVLVVDNDSHDGSREWLARDHPFPLRVFHNDVNASFSAANNQVLDEVRGDLTLLLNNDVDPMHPDWLTRLVDELVGDPGVAAVGPLLVYPQRPNLDGESYAHPDLTVQHAGVAYAVDNGRVRARNVDAGADPRRPGHRRTRDVAGLTAACLLVRTSDLRDLGGFDEAYFYGSEDWDLGLRLSERGVLRLVGRSVLFHHEYGTQEAVAAADLAAWRLANHAHFNGTWGPRMWRQVMLERLGGVAHASLPDPSRVVLADDVPQVEALRRDFAALGWSTHPDDDRVPDLALIRADGTGIDERGERRPGGGLTVALSDGVPEADALDAADVVAVSSRAAIVGGVRPVVQVDWADVASGTGTSTTEDQATATRRSAERALALVSAVRTQVARPRVGIRTCVPDHQRAPTWGDSHFAASFREALARRGLASAVHILPEWDEARAHTFDIVVHLRGLRAYRPRPGATNVLWVISHADAVTDDELDAYDLVLVASRPYAEVLAARTTTLVQVMHQATDVHRFHPTSRRPRQAAGGVVVAENARWPTRRGPRWLLELGRDFSLYGSNWEGTPEERHVVATWVPNDELCEVYAQADVVVADQWDHMAREGFVANRLFDVAAAGGFVVSDDGPGVQEVFGDLVPTYRSRAELRDVLDHYLGHPGERDRLARGAMALVRREHSFDARVDRLLDLLEIA